MLVPSSDTKVSWNGFFLDPVSIGTLGGGLAACALAIYGVGQCLKHCFSGGKNFNSDEAIFLKRWLPHQDDPLLKYEVELCSQQGQLFCYVNKPENSFRVEISLKGKSIEEEIARLKKLRPIIGDGKICFSDEYKSALNPSIALSDKVCAVSLVKSATTDGGYELIVERVQGVRCQISKIHRVVTFLLGGRASCLETVDPVFGEEALQGLQARKIETWSLSAEQVLKNTVCPNKKPDTYSAEEAWNLVWEKKILKDMGVSDDDLSRVERKSRESSPQALSPTQLNKRKRK